MVLEKCSLLCNNHIHFQEKIDYQIEFDPAPRITEADKSNNKRSLQRALDQRLYLLLYGPKFGSPSGKSVWHFSVKVYASEQTLHECTKSALKSVIGDLSHTYFVGNAPMGHNGYIASAEADQVINYFKSQVIATNKFYIGKYEDFVWVTKEHFPKQAEYLNKMITS